MIVAVQQGKVDCLEILVQAGADLEAKDKVRVEFDGHVYSVGIEGGRGRGNGVQGWGKGREGRWGKGRVGWVGGVERGGQLHSNFGTIKFINK